MIWFLRQSEISTVKKGQDQLKEEFINVIDLVLYIFNALGFTEFKTRGG